MHRLGLDIFQSAVHGHAQGFFPFWVGKQDMTNVTEHLSMSLAQNHNVASSLFVVDVCCHNPFCFIGESRWSLSLNKRLEDQGEKGGNPKQTSMPSSHKIVRCVFQISRDVRMSIAVCPYFCTGKQELRLKVCQELKEGQPLHQQMPSRLNANPSLPPFQTNSLGKDFEIKQCVCARN